MIEILKLQVVFQLIGDCSIDTLVVGMVLQSSADSPSCQGLSCHVWYWSPSCHLGPDWSGGASTMVPCSTTTSILGSGKCSNEFWTGFWTWYHWLPSAKEPAFGYKAVSKSSTATLSQHRGSLPLGHLCPGGDGGWNLCCAHLGCWAWTTSTLSPWLADHGQREMVPLPTDQAEWKKGSEKLLSLFSCLLPVKALADVQQWTCWSYGPVLHSLQCTKRTLQIHVSGFAELCCILQHKGNLPPWDTARLWLFPLPLNPILHQIQRHKGVNNVMLHLARAHWILLYSWLTINLIHFCYTS